MLSKNNIDKKLKKYMKEHLSKGYSKHAVKKVLVNHGYDEFYVDGLLKRHSESQIVKKYAIFVFFLFLILPTVQFFISMICASSAGRV